VTPVTSDFYDVSGSTLKPLMKMFWNTQGWRNQPLWPNTDVFNRAVRAGVMFSEQLVIDHDECVKAAQEAAASVSPGDLADAFVASLTTERLDLRSAIGSFAVARHLFEHPYSPTRDSARCTVCGLLDRSKEDLNRLNFERFKWGGTQRDNLCYIAFDLEQFVRAPREHQGGKALDVGRRLIQELRHASPQLTASQMAGQLKVVKGKTAEREVLLDILGVCGILRTPEHSGYATRFVTAIERVLPARSYVPRSYPVCWWTGHNGVDDNALRMFLPQLAD